MSRHIRTCISRLTRGRRRCCNPRLGRGSNRPIRRDSRNSTRRSRRFDRVTRPRDPSACAWPSPGTTNVTAAQKAPEKIVLETTTAPSPEARLAIEIDDTMPSPGGPATHAAQSSQQTLDRAFFIDKFACVAACDPSAIPPSGFGAQCWPARLPRAVDGARRDGRRRRGHGGALGSADES